MGIDLGASELAGISLASSLGSAVIGAVGAESSASAQAASATYNAEIATQNQQIATQNANLAAASGEQQAAISEQKTRAKEGGIITGEAAGNINVMTGSAVDVQTSEKALGLQDALTIKSNAARQAYGYQTQAYNYGAESNLYGYEAQTAQTAGMINAGSTLLGGAASGLSNYARFLQAGSLNA